MMALIRRSRLTACTGMAFAYIVAGKLALLLAIPPGYATAVWPAAGIALAAMLIFGTRLWPGVLIGSFIVNVGVSFDASSSVAILRSVVVALLIGGGATLQAWIGAQLVRRFVGYPTPLDIERDVGVFLLLGGPVACLVNATVSVTTLFAIEAISLRNVPFSWLTWWVGDTIGVVTVAPLVMAWLAEPRTNWRRRRIALTAPLGVTVGGALAFFILASAWEQDRVRRDFQSYADGIHDRVMLALDVESSIEVLQSVRDFRSNSPAFDLPAFRNFVSSALVRHPEIVAVSWNPLVRQTDRAAFEETARAAGLYGYQIRENGADGRLQPAPVRADYVPVLYIEPLQLNRQVLGYNVAADAERDAALIAARDRDMPEATGQVLLIQGAPGVVIYLPVFRKGWPHETVAQRRQALEGYVAGVFHFDPVLAAARQEMRRAQINLEVIDERSARVILTYRSDAAGPLSARMSYDDEINIGGRRWIVRLTPTDDYLASHRSWQAWSSLVAALLFAGLLGGFLLVMTGRHSRVEMLVETRTAELARLNEELREEVSLRMASERDLHDKNLELKRADEAKDRFLAGMSHELRTPLNAIIGFTGTLMMKLAGPLTADQERQLGTVESSARHLLSLINDLLDLTKIESGKVEISLQPTACAEVIDEVTAALRPLAVQKGLAFEVRLPDPPPVVETDRRAMSQILLNLVSNAIKYTERGQVTVRCVVTGTAGEPQVEIEVGDTGIGMREEDHARLFQAFTQLDASSSRRYEGTGLGLHLSSRLAELIGADIRFESRFGEGSRFTLTLPMQAGPASTDGVF